MAWTLCSSYAAITKAGAGANTTLIADVASMALFSDQVEASINTQTRKDWVAGFDDVKANFQGILDDTASDMIAMKIIAYDTDGYSSTAQYQVMLDVLRDNSTRNISALKLDENKEKM